MVIYIYNLIYLKVFGYLEVRYTSYITIYIYIRYIISIRYPSISPYPVRYHRTIYNISINIPLNGDIYNISISFWIPWKLDIYIYKLKCDYFPRW